MLQEVHKRKRGRIFVVKQLNEISFINKYSHYSSTPFSTSLYWQRVRIHCMYDLIVRKISVCEITLGVSNGGECVWIQYVLWDNLNPIVRKQLI